MMAVNPARPRDAATIPFDQAFGIAHAMNNLLAIVAGQLDDIQARETNPAAARDAAALGLLSAERAARLMRGMMASLTGEAWRPGYCDSLPQLRMVEAARRAPGLPRVALMQEAEAVTLRADPVALADLLGNTLDVLMAPEAEPIRISCHALADALAELTIEGGSPRPAGWQPRTLGQEWHVALDQFARAGGGEAMIEPCPDGSVTIRLRLPRLDEGQVPAAPVAARAQVLVVEDDEPLRRHAERVIAELGYRVVSAPSGEAALAMLRTGLPVDLLFTDVVMPGGMSGGELAGHVHTLRPGLPIIFTSGHHADPRVAMLLGDAGTMHLPKPYRRSSLAQCLAHALARAGAGRRS